MKKEYFVLMSEEEKDNLERLLDIDNLNDKLYYINEAIENVLWKIEHDKFYSKYSLNSDLDEILENCKITEDERELLDNLEEICDNISHICNLEDEIEYLREDD